VLIPIAFKSMSQCKPLHIITTSFLDGNEVLVGFSDGTSAIYAEEELEKLRPVAKCAVPDHLATGGNALYPRAS
jgi:hypothetical protein